tara:strand:- start:150 stop:317 length:168 start_codon:yes stop_codon:yes gene_type:complete
LVWFGWVWLGLLLLLLLREIQSSSLENVNQFFRLDEENRAKNLESQKCIPPFGEA